MLEFFSIADNPDNPTILTILFTVLFAFVLGGMIVFTYERTTRDVNRPEHFMQALVLIAIVAATVMQAIGDSLARGLGMLGALSIIRFRTTLRNPRNIVFMFSSLAAGIACGVFGFVIAFVGTTVFCLAAFLLRLTPFSVKRNLTGKLTFLLHVDSKQLPEVEKVLKSYCRNFVLVRYRLLTGRKLNQIRYEYRIKMVKDTDGSELASALLKLEGLSGIRVEFNEINPEI